MSAVRVMRGHEYGVLVAYLGPSHVSMVARWNLKQPSHAGQQTLTRTGLFIGGKYRLILILIPLDDTKPFRR